MNYIRFAKFIVIFAACVVGCVPGLFADEPTATEKREVKRIKTTMDKAGKLFVDGDFRLCANSVQSAQKRLTDLLKNADEELITLVKPEYDRIKKAHELLKAKEIELDALPALEAKAMADETGISFVKQVAPILNAKCGRCHVGRSQGRFSLASYEILMRGPTAGKVVFEKDADGSRLIEIIEEGDMPRGGLTVSAEELKILKDWISAGAKFDGDDPAQNISQLGGEEAEPEMEEEPLAVEMASGKETVSFAMDVAPVFVERCSGCHFEAQNNRGGLTLDRFVDVLRGGDGGAMITPGDGSGSELIKRLRGDGVAQMPPGRNPLPEETIKKISTWIDEGARFDGRDANLNLRSVYALAKATRASHEELLTDRKELTETNWRMAMSNIDMKMVQSENFQVVGTADEEKLREISELAEAQTEELKSFFKIDKKDRLVKGNITIYAFSRRYDYSEFGTMVEKRNLPRQWDGHWGYSTVDAYVSIIVPKTELQSIEPELARYIASTVCASHGVDVPAWYSDGVGYAYAAKEFSREEIIDQWKSDADSALGELAKGDEIVKGQIPDDKAALVGFRFAEVTLRAKNRFYNMLATLKQGVPFAEAFQQTYNSSLADAAIALRRQAGR